MALTQENVKAAYLLKEAKTAEPQEAVSGAPGTLTFITSEGEAIIFDGMDVPVGEAAALAGEDALGKIWNRPAEDAAWQDM